LAINTGSLAEWDVPEDLPVIEPVAVGLAGETPAGVTRYLMARGAGRARVSADGSKIAFAYRVTGEPQLWIVDASGGWPTQLTFGTGITFFEWAPNGTHLIVGRDADGNEREGYYLISADGTDERQLLPLSDAFRVFGMFSDDSSQFLYSSTERNGRDFDIYVADVQTGDSRRVYEGSFGNFPASWQPGGDLVIVDETRGEDGNDVHLLDLKSGELTPLFQPEVSAFYGDYEWLNDSSGFFLTTDQDREFKTLAFYSLETETLDFFDLPAADVDSVTLSGGGEYLAWTSNDDGYSGLHVTRRSDGAALDVPDLPPGVYQIQFSHAANTLMIRVTGPATPGDVFVWDVASGGISRAVESSLAGLKQRTFVIPESLRFSARDGVELQGLLYRPVGITNENPPVVVNVHGGPTSQSRPTFKAPIQYLVANGVAVFDVNVRGSTGFGKTYARLDNQEKRLDSVRDLVDTVVFLSRTEGLNASRIAVMGGSYGGYMVNAVLGAYPGVFDAGASFVGVSDWVRALSDASPALKASDRIEYGDIREQKWQDFYAVNSPINTADRISVPLFVQHGANDPRDPVSESDRIVRTVRENGGTVTYMRFPDEGHSISKQANRVAFYRKLVEFLEQHLVHDADTAEK
jgi:dipeptidyl aminopeptidase/acylaminoacyl peptidase